MSRILKVIVFLLFCKVGFLQAYAQPCDTLYEAFETTKPAFPKDPYQEVFSQILPPLSELKETYGIVISRLTLKLMISSEGKILKVDFVQRLPEKYQDMITENLRRNSTWEAAEVKGVPVCSILLYPINCILWRE
jgi:hypothetical protein